MNFKRFLQNSGFLFARHGLSFLLGFLGSLVLARVYGLGELAVFFTALQLHLTFRSFLDLGLRTLTIRVPQGEQTQTRFFESFLVLQAGALLFFIPALIFGIAPWYASWWKNPELEKMILMAGLGACGQVLLSYPVGRLEKDLRYRDVGVIEIAESLSFNLTCVLIALFQLSPVHLGWAFLFRTVLPFMLAWAWSPRPHRGLKKSKPPLRPIFWLGKAMPLVGSEGIVSLIGMAPGIVIPRLGNPSSLALGQMAYTLLGYTLLVPTILQRVGLAWFSRLQNKRADLGENFHRILQGLVYIYFPLILIFGGTSPLWVPWLYGEKWLELPSVVHAAALPVALVSFLMPFHSLLIAKGKIQIVFLQNLLHAALYWGSMALLTKIAGPLSMPLAHLSAVFAGVLFLYWAKRVLARFDLREFILPVAYFTLLWMILPSLRGHGGEKILITTWSLAVGGGLFLFPAFRTWLFNLKKIVRG